jgi:5-methylcytosine-specific restriction protein B
MEQNKIMIDLEMSHFWRERFGDRVSEGARFKWTEFYEDLATQLAKFKGDRKPLMDGLHKIANEIDSLNHLNDKDSNGNRFPLKDICPFTVFGCFNRGITDSNRIQIAQKFAELLKVESAVPSSFEGIPILNNQKSWFFAYDFDRNSDDIDVLWEIFDLALKYSDDDDEKIYERLLKAYDDATRVKNVGWNLTMGLYWIRPWSYIPLDGRSQQYITDKLNTTIGKNGPKDRCNADDYFKVLSSIESRFKEASFPVHSFPELSLEAWRYQPSSTGGVSADTWKQKIHELIKAHCTEKGSAEFSRKEFQDKYVSYLKEIYPTNNTVSSTIDRQMQVLRDDDIIEFVSPGVYKWLEFGAENLDENGGFSIYAIDSKSYEPFSLNDILKDGCFFDRTFLDGAFNTLKRKKNIVLQGPPGTGKTWLGKRLAFALVGERNEQKVKAVQFHANLSYEDFIRGWRPSGNSTLELVDGPFLEMVYFAQNNPDSNFVIVIEEINRGKPSQIFGEILTLLEADKRTPNEALELTYGNEKNKKVYIPENFYVIGTMNIADRSLALVDLALRRRFSFIDLTPQLGEPWKNWLKDNFRFSSEFLSNIESRINGLNQSISNEPLLGEQFQVGHSYVTPVLGHEISDPEGWFKEVVTTEIYPLLQEYFFDSSAKAIELRNELLRGL